MFAIASAIVALTGAVMLLGAALATSMTDSARQKMAGMGYAILLIALVLFVLAGYPLLRDLYR